jgi:enamine deaminase RidA (YjgF/YER057c/UK114 family)
MKNALLIAPLLLIATSAAGADVVRHKIPNSDFPIAQAVEIPAGKTLVFVSGAGPDIADKAADKNSPAAYGDTKAQTLNTLKKIEATLKSLGLRMNDVVKMQVFLVGDPALGGKMDFAGLMDSYRQFFGTAEQPDLPARSAMQVAALANPGWLVEIEVTAVRPDAKH